MRYQSFVKLFPYNSCLLVAVDPGHNKLNSLAAKPFKFVIKSQRQLTCSYKGAVAISEVENAYLFFCFCHNLFMMPWASPPKHGGLVFSKPNPKISDSVNLLF